LTALKDPADDQRRGIVAITVHACVVAIGSDGFTSNTTTLSSNGTQGAYSVTVTSQEDSASCWVITRIKPKRRWQKR
jgi:hypothetical protein